LLQPQRIVYPLSALLWTGWLQRKECRCTRPKHTPPLWGSVRSYLHRYTRSGISNENGTRTQRQRDINETSTRHQRDISATTTQQALVFQRYLYGSSTGSITVSILYLLNPEEKELEGRESYWRREPINRLPIGSLSRSARSCRAQPS